MRRNQGISPILILYGADAIPQRNDGATIRGMSRRRSTSTPPGGVAHPVVGVVPAVLAPRRPPPVTLPNGVWTTPRGHTISAITHTTRNIDCNGYKSHSVADVSLNLLVSASWKRPRRNATAIAGNTTALLELQYKQCIDTVLYY